MCCWRVSLVTMSGLWRQLKAADDSVAVRLIAESASDDGSVTERRWRRSTLNRSSVSTLLLWESSGVTAADNVVRLQHSKTYVNYCCCHHCHWCLSLFGRHGKSRTTFSCGTALCVRCRTTLQTYKAFIHRAEASGLAARAYKVFLKHTILYMHYSKFIPVITKLRYISFTYLLQSRWLEDSSDVMFDDVLSYLPFNMHRNAPVT